MDRFFKIVFIAAGIYNIAWGIFSAVFPEWLFHFAGMPPMRYPEIFQCVAMIVGVYGVLYLYVAFALERGWLIIAIGLLGKILGPLGFLSLLVSGKWPIDAIVLILSNDLIWWIPFTLYLIRYFEPFRAEIRARLSNKHSLP